MNDSINYGNSSVEVSLLLIQNDYVSDMSGLAVYVKEGLPFSQDLFLENSSILDWLYVTQCFTSSSSFLTFFVFVCCF